MSVRFAWPSYGAPWATSVQDVQVDGEDATDSVDATRRRVRLDKTGEWAAATLTVTAATDEEIPDGLTSVEAFVVISSPRSHTRVPYMLETGDPPTKSFSGTIALRREILGGAVTMRLDLAADIDGRRRLVGIGEEWAVIVDASEAPAPPGRPPFETSWIDFNSSSAAIAARRHPDAHAVMDLSQAKPTLLLNEGIDGFKSLMLAKSARHERRRLRTLLGSSIARQATATLIRAAASEVVPFDQADEPQAPQDVLQRQTCEAVADAMASIGSVSELYERIVQAAFNPPLRDELWAEIDAAIDRLTGYSAHVAAVLEEVKYV